MRFTWFNLMPWPDLPDDFREKNRSVWVDIDSRLFEPVRAHGVYNTYMDNDVVSGCQITRVGTSPSYSYDFSGRPVGTEADWANRPVNFVSWFDAARFANWMTTGNTESGVYNTTAWVAMDHPLAAATYGTAYFLPTEDEWYKAAYYDPNKPGGAGYWDYPTRSDSVPTWEPPPGGANSANYFDVTTADYAIGGPYYRNTVGAYVASRSPYGTYDQGGNVYEWNETESTAHRGIRGGSFSYYPSYMNAGVRNFGDPAFENDDNLGFRIASISAVIPEPGSLVLMVLAAAGAARHRKHRAP